jgi:toxin ParE1/3/4
MSKFTLQISPQAKTDLEQIYVYTLENHGPSQAGKYLSKIEHAFKGLLDNPEMGRERSDVRSGYRSLAIEKHVCFYKITKAEIQILGVVHGRMDILNYFTHTNF